ncbi:MAG: ilvD1 [Blastococcus sp.]|nr:ilvD1 [Blastococcus sp.]
MTGAAASSPSDLRSAAWLSAPGKAGSIVRTHLFQAGLAAEDLVGKPVVGILSTWSEATPCNAGLRQLADRVARGVLAAGGVPLETPVMSLSEPLMRPTTMLYRNLLSIEVEEVARANPFDALVLLGGCDKTVPGLLMGAASVDLPSVVVTTGPMLSGSVCGRPAGSGTDLWRVLEERRAGLADDSDVATVERGLSRSAGHCMTMGTASTMACLTEVLGMQLPGGAAAVAVGADRSRLAAASGRLAVTMAQNGGPRPSALLTREAFENALITLAAIGGSTNAVLHLLALAGRVGVPLDLDDVDRLARDVPVLLDVEPSGTGLMADVEAAGGVPALLGRLLPLLHAEARTVTGATLAEVAAAASLHDEGVIRPLSRPVAPAGGLAVVRGNLAPGGAVIKVASATPALLQHTGPAWVFDRVEDYLAAAADPANDPPEDVVVVVRGAGPRGWPGMPEIGNLPIPVRLLEKGVRDVVRICDGRMSGTAYGTVVLHVAPESAAGGPLGLVRNGDLISLDLAGRRLDLLVAEEELGARREASPSVPASTERGWTGLHRRHVLQADRGADLDFLVGASGSAVPRAPF